MVQHSVLQRAIETAINQPNYAASLPPLSDKTWMKILEDTRHARAENERLEFVGDALMYATLGRQLYTQVPNGTPGLYTCVRAALHSNATFSLLAEKLDIMAVNNSVLQALTKRTFGEGASAPNKSRPEMKATADLFETVIGAYYFDHGFEALCAWVEELYTPLIEVVAETYYQHQHGLHGTYRAPGANKRTVEPSVYKPALAGSSSTAAAAPPVKKKGQVSPVKQRSRTDRTHASRASCRPSVKTSIIGTSNVKAKVAPPSSSGTLLKTAEKKPAMQMLPVVKQAPDYIDLTLDSDSDDPPPLSIKHTLVPPRIPRSSLALSKRPTPVPLRAATIPPGLTATDVGGAASSDTDDEMMLESMLVDSGSDMDCGSSDVETPVRPLILAPHVSRPDLGGLAMDIAHAPFASNSVFMQ